MSIHPLDAERLTWMAHFKNLYGQPPMRDTIAAHYGWTFGGAANWVARMQREGHLDENRNVTRREDDARV